MESRVDDDANEASGRDCSCDDDAGEPEGRNLTLDSDEESAGGGDEPSIH